MSFGFPGAPQNGSKVNLGTPWSAQVSPDIAKDLKNDAQDLPEIEFSSIFFTPGFILHRFPSEFCKISKEFQQLSTDVPQNSARNEIGIPYNYSKIISTEFTQNLLENTDNVLKGRW